MTTLAAAIRAALLESDPREKVMKTRALVRAWRKGQLDFAFDVDMPDEPGRPASPELLPPSRMPKRGRGGSERARIALWHSLAHIEFVAIDLALDMAGRFGAEMGRSFVSDFLTVAADEAMHFALIERHLATMGAHYGVLPAHGGLWDAARKTAHDVAARLAVVPMVLEARGLDVTPGMIEIFRKAADPQATAALEIIYAEEVGHVAYGSKWFHFLCGRHEMDPKETFHALVRRYFHGTLKPPFNEEKRAEAGLPPDFYWPLAEEVPDRTAAAPGPAPVAD